MSRFMEDDEPVDEEEEENSFAKPQRLVEGINLNELFSGKGKCFFFTWMTEGKSDTCNDMN